MDKHFISPSFEKSKLDNPIRMNKIEVFEDRLTGWLFTPMKKLIEVSDGMALLSLCLGYFEMIGQYEIGESSDRQSKKVFLHGLNSVFEKELETIKSLSDPAKNLDATSREWHKSGYETLTDGFYKMGRCGMFHSGMPKYGFMIMTNKDKLFILEEIVRFQLHVNPWVMAERIEQHFTEYIGYLKANADKPEDQILLNFEKRFDLNSN